jgi:hypothetical protein
MITPSETPGSGPRLRRQAALQSFWLTIGWLFAWRWCLLGWAFLLGFPALAVWGAPSMLEGAFDVGPGGIFCVSLSVFFLCFSLRLLGTMAVAYGPRRTGLARPRWVKWIRQPAAGWRGYILWICLGVPVIWHCIYVSSQSAPRVEEAFRVAPVPELAGVDYWKVLELAGPAVLGLVIALAVFVLALLLHRRGTHDPNGPPSVDDSLYANPRSPQWLKSWFEKAENAPPWKWLTHLSGSYGTVARWGFGPQGYYHPATNRLQSGHRLYFLMGAAVCLFVYTPLYFVDPPVLVYLTNLMLMVVWILNALAFALDRYRIPVALPLVFFIVISGYCPWTQYRFRSSPWQPGPHEVKPLTAAELLGGEAGDCPVVVAAEGGGIHAGAWTTHVLRTLENEYAGRVKGMHLRDSFAKHIVCVSGVSGGSYGLMYWVDSYGRAGGPASSDYQSGTTYRLTEERATRSSLEASIRGLVYHDIWRTFMPVAPALRGWDRGSFLENEWVLPPQMSGNEEYRGRSLADTTMRDWLRDAGARLRPAVLFNCMNADSGQPVVFSTTTLADSEDNDLPSWEYRRLRKNEDVPVVTAVRCSASFPFVCPAASPETDRKGTMHLVDGGYYDNFGMASLNRWLDLAASRWEEDRDRGANPPSPETAAITRAVSAPRPPKKLLVIQVRASSASLFDEKLLTREWDDKGRTGFLYQALVPLTGLINVRGVAQTWHNDQQYNNIVERLRRLGIDVRTAVFRFPGMDNPLSWHLTTNQKLAVRNIYFNPPPSGNKPEPYNLETAPRCDSERKHWAEWTRYQAQWALHGAWQQVWEHLLPEAAMAEWILKSLPGGFVHNDPLTWREPEQQQEDDQ